MYHSLSLSPPLSLCLSLSFSQYIYIYIYIYIGIDGKGFTNVPEGQGPISVRVIPRTQKIVLDHSFLNTLHYKVLERVK